MPGTVTQNYQLNKPDFNESGWHDDVNGNMDVLDSILFVVSGISNFVGTWSNSTVYNEGHRVLDPDTSALYQALVAHTSPGTGSFELFRNNNPGYWQLVSVFPNNRGEWAEETVYAVGDWVYHTDESVIAVCTMAHTSSAAPATIRDDVDNWHFAFDINVWVPDPDDLDDATTAHKFASEDQLGKVDQLTVTAPTNLDDIRIRVDELEAAITLKGTWDAGTGAFPASASAGDSYIVDGAGTVDGESFGVDDRLIALIDDPSTSTFAGNWYKANYSDVVTSVVGLGGNIQQQDLLEALEVEPGVDVEPVDAAILRANQTKELTKGFTTTSLDLGSKASGTLVPAISDRQFQHVENAGNWDLAPPTNHGTMVLDIINGASAGTVTIASGYASIEGVTISDVNGEKFRCWIANGQAGATILVTQVP